MAKCSAIIIDEYMLEMLSIINVWVFIIDQQILQMLRTHSKISYIMTQFTINSIFRSQLRFNKELTQKMFEHYKHLCLKYSNISDKFSVTWEHVCLLSCSKIWTLFAINFTIYSLLLLIVDDASKMLHPSYWFEIIADTFSMTRLETLLFTIDTETGCTHIITYCCVP